MNKKYLIVNRGSASEKYAVYENGECLAFIHLEKIEDGKSYISTVKLNDLETTGLSSALNGVPNRSVDNPVVSSVTKKEFEHSLKYSIETFKTAGVISSEKDIAGIGIRIVAPGKHFQDDKVIDKVYEKEIKNILHDAPLHILPTYEAIKDLKKIFKNVPIVGVSDSDFHDTLPDRAKFYGLPKELTQKYQIERYGYHGISVESVLEKLKFNGQLSSRIIICHIGSGVSVTAIKDGKSIENSMGFTPLEGVMMATRAGDIDPGTVAYIGEKLGLKGRKLKEYLNMKCGLFGVSGLSSDVRDLIKVEKEGNTQAKLALDMYAYKLQKTIGAYYVALGGLDTLIFTATVGERSFVMRERICQDLAVLGVKINTEINNISEGVDVDISAPDSKVKVLVATTDEMGQIARDTARVLSL